MLDKFVPAYKVGSGDINWPDALVRIAKKQKPVFLATGASSLAEVTRAVQVIRRHNRLICLMQCNTNYTGDVKNLGYVQLNVLKTYAEKFPDAVLGLSDHTPGDIAVLGAVALGARVIEKHFTDDRTRVGPDHGFSMDPRDFRQMVERVRRLEMALGTGIKKVEDNEKDTVIVQRRCCRAAHPLKKGKKIRPCDIAVLRPAPQGSYPPNQLKSLIGKRVKNDMPKGASF
jgi:N-acetylneuraminate synthase